MSLAEAVMSRAQVALGSSLWSTDAKLREQVRDHAERFETSIRKAGNATSLGFYRRRAHHILNSFSCKLSALLLAWPAKTPPETWDRLKLIALSLSARYDCGEPVRVRAKKKKSGGYRPICVFGPRRRALQLLVRELLAARLGQSPFEYAAKGRGRDRAMAAITTAVQKKGGPRWFLTADVRSCYASINAEALFEAHPLPSNVLKNCFLVHETVPLIMETTHTSETAARAGLPQGSLASPYLASKLLEGVLRQLTGEIVISNADDVLTGTRTRVECDTNEHALRELLAAHPAGPLLMKVTNIAELGNPIDFLGYRIRRRWLRYGGGARAVPSPSAFAAFRTKLTIRLEATKLADLEQVAADYTNRWLGAHSAWERSQSGDDRLWIWTAQDIVSPVRQSKGVSKWKVIP